MLDGYWMDFEWILNGQQMDFEWTTNGYLYILF